MATRSKAKRTPKRRAATSAPERRKARLLAALNEAAELGTSAAIKVPRNAQIAVFDPETGMLMRCWVVQTISVGVLKPANREFLLCAMRESGHGVVTVVPHD